jgi:hypothetical protein
MTDRTRLLINALARLILQAKSEYAYRYKEKNMPKKKVNATKLTVGLPFNLGSLEFESDEAQQTAP